MKKQHKIITGVLFLIIYFVCVLYILPKENDYYLNSDISDFKGSTIVISVIISIILTFLILFDLSQLKLGIWKKINHIFYLGILGCFTFMMLHDTVTAIGLIINKTSQTGTLSKDFKISHKDILGDNEYVRGRYLEREYKGEIDRLYVGKDYYSKLNENQIITLNLKKGILSVPFKPVITE